MALQYPQSQSDMDQPSFKSQLLSVLDGHAEPELAPIATQSDCTSLIRFLQLNAVPQDLGPGPIAVANMKVCSSSQCLKPQKSSVLKKLIEHSILRSGLSVHWGSSELRSVGDRSSLRKQLFKKCQACLDIGERIGM